MPMAPRRFWTGGRLSRLRGQRMRCAPYGHPELKAYFRRRSARAPIRGSRGGQGMIRDVRRIRFERAYRERQRRPILKIFGSWGCSPSGGRPEYFLLSGVFLIALFADGMLERRIAHHRMTGGRPSLFAGLGFVPGGLIILSSVAALLPTVVSEWCFWVIPVLFGLAMRHMAARWHRLPR